MQHKLGLVSAAVAAAILFSVVPGPSFGQDQEQAKAKGKGKGKAKEPSKPTPHWPDGHVNLGPAPGENGVWNTSGGTTLASNPRGVGLDGLRAGAGGQNNGPNLSTNITAPEIPMLPWARTVYDYRQATLTADDPHVRCKPSGGPRMYGTPYGAEIVEIPEMKQIFIVGVGGPHTYRTVYLDGQHPADVDPGFSGDSIGHFEGGDTLVVDTIGFNEKFWLTREGNPHTDKLHLIERFTRTDYNTLKYEATFDDPGALTGQWKGGWNISWSATGDLYEYACQDNNRDIRHMFGGDQ